VSLFVRDEHEVRQSHRGRETADNLGLTYYPTQKRKEGCDCV